MGPQALENATVRPKTDLFLNSIDEDAMSRTARELAEFLGATLEGEGNTLIHGVAAPEQAGEHDLIYVESPRHAERAASTRAGCAIAGESIVLSTKSILRVAQPKLAFARAAALIRGVPRVAEGIHPTAIISKSAVLAEGVAVGPYAVIEDDAQIGAGTQVGAFAFVGKGSRIGRQCLLHARVTIHSGVILGDSVTVHSGAVIGGDGFGYVFGEGKHWKFPQTGGVIIEDEVEIGANTTIDRGSLGTTRIGCGTKIDNLVQVAHNVVIGAHSIIAAQTGISGSSSIGTRVLVGGQVGIADRCRIEDDAVLGAQCGVPSGKAVHSKQVVWGTPARPLDKFKEMYAWFARLPELAARIKALETKGGAS
jgi:UDP-3-O-[3-hydroxymyristoyl] glucosamine N-acyltransferase